MGIYPKLIQGILTPLLALRLSGVDWGKAGVNAFQKFLGHIFWFSNLGCAGITCLEKKKKLTHVSGVLKN